MKNAYGELLEELRESEQVEAVVFGRWGDSNFSEPEFDFIPNEMKNIVLTLEQAKPYMKGWSFDGGFGAPECYATYIWTNQRVFWVTQYDGSTRLDSAPRNPIDCMPYMPGG